MKRAQKRSNRPIRTREAALRLLLPGVALVALSVASYVAVAETPEPEASDEEKIADASRSAPKGLVADARILDWPEEPGGEFRVLREGTNGWNCLPDFRGDSNYAPECFDDEWLAFLKAYLEGRQPSTKRIGLSYMLNARWAVSNTDRAATAPTADNQWREGGSHLMLVVPDPAMLEWFPTEPTPNSGAYAMFSGTPYAHLMIPVPEAHAPDG
jgi:hypothetical protein